MTPPVEGFDPSGPLPSGLTVLEASAGTGKTYALCALAVRYVAEVEVPPSALCVVSFTEAATAELRGRVRERLVEAADHLEAGAPTTDDPVLGALARAATPDELDRRRARLRAAIAEFDLATISTIHGLCARVLAGAGVAAPDAELVDGGSDVDEAVTDVLVAHSEQVRDAEIDPDRFAQLVRVRLAMPDASVFPKQDDTTRLTSRSRLVEPAVTAAELVELAARRVLERRSAARRRTFTELLTDTRDLLAGVGGHGVIDALRQRYRVVLVDEFQDTDRVQWEIFRRAFVEPDPQLAPPATVILVGDPKQSIYRFRSADLAAYLDARRVADSVASLDTNWRSDAPLLEALEVLLGHVEFGAETVRYQHVGAAPDHGHRRLHGAGPASVVLRCVPPDSDGLLSAPQARRTVRNDLVATVAELLARGVQVEDPRTAEGRRPLAPRDIAVLTRSNADAALCASLLSAKGIPAATSSATSVLDTEAARQWTVLLRALERPGHPGLARAAALGWFCGIDPVELVAFDEHQLADLHDQLRDWAGVLATRGVPHLLAKARAGGLARRLLSRTFGERDITDLDHVAELLQSATGGRPATASTLLTVLRDLWAGGAGSPARDLLSRRIDRDDDAVQVLTIHRAKGLEFPVVLCPFLWTQPLRQGPQHAHVGGQRVLDGSWLVKADRQAWNRGIRDGSVDEQRAEELRQLYVALTRARHHLVVWWAQPAHPTRNGVRYPENRLGEVLGGAVGVERPVHPDELADLDGRAGGALAVQVVAPSRATVLAAPAAPPAPALAVATARRQLDPAWRIWSFSALTAAASTRGPAAVETDDATSRPVVGGVDEPLVPEVVGARAAVTASPLRDAPAGAAFGTLVHRVLERCDFASPTLDADLVDLCAAELRYRPMAIGAEQLAAGLATAVRAPLGGPLGQLGLADLPRGDRLDELTFDLRLARVRADQIGEVLAVHLPDDDPFRPWAAGLAAHGFGLDIAGMLTGSIDLAARTPDGASFFVADYKTNQLGAEAGYTAGELVVAMEHAHYPLQAALYLVAAHRYLRWRLASYDPDRHLAGAAYLFLRGMHPTADADEPSGVLWWRPPAGAIVALDRLLAEGASR